MDCGIRHVTKDRCGREEGPLDANAINVLLIEDNPGDAEIISEQLSSSPGTFSIIPVSSLRDSLDVLSTAQIDVIITDLGLPDSAGLDTVAALRRRSADCAIVVLTGIEDEELGLRAMRAGATDFLTKSGVTPAGLARATAHARERRRLEATQEALRRVRRHEAVGRLSFGIAHHYNNILALIKGHAFMLRRRLSCDAPNIAHLEAIEEAAERARLLTVQLIQYCDQDAVDGARVDVNEALAAIAGRLRDELGPGIELVVELEPGLPPASMDRMGLEQSLLMLSLYARKAMLSAGRLTIRTGRPAAGDPHARSSFVCVTVIDEACKSGEVGEGDAAGLSVVHGVIQRAGGFVLVEPAPCGGTMVTIHLRTSEEA